MHGSFDNSGKPDSHVRGHSIVGVFALPTLVVIVLVGLVVMHPAASNWIADAVQAEFVGNNPAPDPTIQLAYPAGDVRTVKAN